MDSGVTKHMCTESVHESYDKDKQSIVNTIAKYSTKSISIGEVVLNARLNKKEKNLVKLKDTLCVPGLRNNLLSIARVIDNRYIITFKKYHATINQPNGSVVKMQYPT